VWWSDASPTELELPVWTQVEEVLQRTDEILLELSVYRGATMQIRDVSRLHSFSRSQFPAFSWVLEEWLMVSRVCPPVRAIIPSVLAGSDRIATKLAHDGPQVSLNPGCAQGQGQRSCDTGSFVLSRKSQVPRRFAVRVDSVPS